jgi:uncharacterized coiled-coil protein SlyX
MAELDKRIADLEARMAKYETELDAATTVEEKQSEKLVKERDMWHLLYPEFSTMVKLEHLSGADALVMPVLESERAQYKDEILQVLTTHFMEKGKVHRDVRWSNIGKYRSRTGAVALIVYDLHDVVDYDVEVHHGWIEKAMQSLFVVAFEEKNALILVDNSVMIGPGVLEVPVVEQNKLNIDNYMVYARRLNSVIRIARYISYQLACLSTLGGANHLCDKPKTALKIAMRQEFIGLAIGSTSIVIRSKVYQAVNYGLMKKANKSKKIFTECEEDALLQGWSSLIDFVKASKIWLQNELEYKKLKSN